MRRDCAAPIVSEIGSERPGEGPPGQLALTTRRDREKGTTMKQDPGHRTLKALVTAKLNEHRIEYACGVEPDPRRVGEPRIALLVRGHGGWYFTARELAFFLGLGKLSEAQLAALAVMWPSIAAEWRERSVALAAA